MSSAALKPNEALNRVSLQEQPYAPAPGAAIKVDRAVVAGAFALISGWFSGGVAMALPTSRKHVLFPRPDVAGPYYPDAKGFLAIVSVAPGSTVVDAAIHFRGGEVPTRIVLSSNPDDLSVTLNEQSVRMGHIVHEVFQDSDWCRLVYNAIPLMSADSVAGYVEQAKVVPGKGAVMLGWAISKGNAQLWLVAENGFLRPLKESIRYARQDIVEAFMADYGHYADMAGFFITLPANLQVGQKVAVVAVVAGQVIKLNEKITERAPASPIGYAQWAFNLPVPDALFMERLQKQDGDFLGHIIQKTAKAESEEVLSWAVGNPPNSPMVSVIIPLYARSDFVEHQLLAFAKDKDFTTGFAEIIYVIDDSRLLNSLRSESFFLHAFHGVPVRFIFGGRNRGFSGANNLGASVAKGQYLLFLNSDVFPEETGWVFRMVNTLVEKPAYGIIGARLLYPTGALQHMGMSFKYSAQYDVWLNEHEGAGMPPIPAEQLPELLDVPAVTGACFVISKADFDRIEGFDEGYLIGDFEDSDICLKVRRTRKEIACITNTRLVHLERQSLKYISTEIAFRQKVVLYNAWRHSARWANQIEVLAD